MEYQKTIAKEVSYTGTGVHTGRHATVVLKPAPPDTGLVFERVDLPGNPRVEARVENVVETRRCTTIGTGEIRIHTVEHLVAALSGMGVDNAFIEIDSIEPPIADGGAAVFARLIREAGLHEQDRALVYTGLSEAQWVVSRDRYIIALPSDGFRVSFTFVSGHQAVGHQYADYLIDPETFEREIAPARTVGFLRELEFLQKQGLALGGSFEIAVVVGEDRILNELRFPDEIVRHKILDIIGDFALLGRMRAHIIGVKSGHALDIQLARKIKGLQQR